MLLELERKWRPILMLWFGFLVGIHWFGWTPESLSDDTVKLTLEIIKIGVGTYIAGRSGEKIMKTWKENL